MTASRFAGKVVAGSRASAEDLSAAPAVPGKRTLTESLGFPPAAPAAPAAPAIAPRPPGAARPSHSLQALFGPPRVEGAPVQRRVSSAANAAASPMAGPADALPADPAGRPMPEVLQARMGRALGADFSDVRIHEGARAAAIGALAYTEGSQIHFAPGAYRPDAADGQALLGHELVHVVQQRAGRVAATTQAKGVAINDDAGLEREADELGARAAARSAAPSELPRATEAAASAGGPVQRKIDFGDLHDMSSPSYQWEEAFAEKLEVRLRDLPAYDAFWRREGMDVHLDAKRQDLPYLEQVKALFSKAAHAELDVAALTKIAPLVTLSETKQHEASLGGDQTLRFTDQQQTLEEQQLAGDKLEKLVVVVREAKQRLAAILERLTPLMKEVDGPETGLLREGLARLLNAPDQEVGKCLPTLHWVLVRMRDRLDERVVAVSTMDRRTTQNKPTTLGKSGPPRSGNWKLDDNKPDLERWSEWLHGDQPFGGSLEMRVDPKHILYEQYHRDLVHSFLHELSHAAASTRDFAYLHEDQYSKVTFLERVANADTVAEIVMELTRGLEVAQQPTAGMDAGEAVVTLNREQLIAKVIELDHEIKDPGVLKVTVTKFFKRYGDHWEDIEEDDRLEDLASLQMAML